MNKGKIVYFGMGFLPCENAVALREIAIADLVKQSGYEPILIGINKNIAFNEFTKKTYKKITIYEVKYPNSTKDRILDTFIIDYTLKKIFNSIGISKIKAFIMQDYQLYAMKKMFKFCKKNNIPFIPDILDWFTPNSDYSLFKNFFKTIDTYLRIHFWYPKLNNKICISSNFKSFFQRKDTNVLELPCTFPTNEFGRRPMPIQKNSNFITLVFAGAPGKHFQKEKLDWIIRSLWELKSTIKLNIIGCSEKSFKNISLYLTKNIRIFDKIKHHDCIKVLKESDFSLVIRESNKLSEYGFSSKISEAFAYSIPIIATNTSDNKKYIKNLENGIICEPNYESVKETIMLLNNLSFEKISYMKSNLYNNNPMDISKFVSQFNVFIDKATSRRNKNV